MKRSSMIAAVCVSLIVALVAASPAAAQRAKKKASDEIRPAIVPKGPQVRLYVEGAVCAGCASVLADTLSQNGVKDASKLSPNAGAGYVIVMGGFSHDGDLGALAKAINGADTPHRNKTLPGLSLELFAKLDEKSAAAAISALEKIDGVDAKGSATDLERGAISVRLKGDKKVSVNAIVAALAKNGVEAKVVSGVAESAPKDAAPAAKEKAKS
jgi:hypothetical protein